MVLSIPPSLTVLAMISTHRLKILICLNGIFLSQAAPAQSPTDVAEQVRSIVERNCLDCHSNEDSNGGLNFEASATLFAQANSGNYAVVRERPDQSELLRRLRSRDEDTRMPPDTDPLTEQEIEWFHQWITIGAPWQAETSPADPQPVVSDHWSFQPVIVPPIPSVADSGWSQNPIDRFLQSKREEAGLWIAPDADLNTLVRRACFALTGLPPTPDEIRDFRELATGSEGTEAAFSDLVDNLLNRPAYGERWGRHWMDWVRYADTAGDNSDFPIPQAYLYRNYIIDSFNADLAYDRFLREQLAGDLLPAETQIQRNRQVIATGYLAMARRFGSLIERYPWHLTIEDTIDNVGRTMLGLTIACARCHDHKFDPISTRDYYGVYGIFASTKFSFPGIELFQTQNDMVPLVPDSEVHAALDPYRSKTEKLTAELERLLRQCEERAIENASAESSSSIGEKRRRRDELDSMLLRARTAGKNLAKHLKEIPALPVAYAVRDGKPHNARIQIRGEPTRLGAEVPRKFPDVLGGQTLTEEEQQNGSGRLKFAHWIAHRDNPLTARVIVNRVWQRHFGQGLVPSTSDFGLRGQPPTHPELLDWLANEFMNQGWSIKHLHRLIMNTHTYRLSSRDFSANRLRTNLETDPQNRYYWRFNRQRLDAESIRDSLLMLSENLDRTPQTSPYPIPPQKEWEYTQHHPFKANYDSRKRSVYLMTRRLTAKPYFQTFDGPDPNVCTSSRDESVTALQALYFVNDDFFHQQATDFAERLISTQIRDSKRVQIAFEKILGRSPTSEEQQWMLDHIAAAQDRLGSQPDAEPQAWSSLIRSLLRTNEFLYVD